MIIAWIKGDKMEVTRFFEALWSLTTAMAPYILFGLLFAGVMHELVSEKSITKHLGRSSVSSVFKATLLGIPLPVCSCGVIPLAASLKKAGASNGATLAFLISTPITGADSVLATYGIFGWLFTLYRIVTSVIIAVAAGIWTNLAGAPPQPMPRFSLNAPKKKDAQPCCSSGGGCCDDSGTSKAFSWRNALRYGFVTLLGDIAVALFWGLVIGALITVAMPEDMNAWMSKNVWASYILAIVVAVPMYVCATASLPIAAGLILGGVSPGAAFVFLTAGPATNTVTIGVVKSMLGNKALVIYLTTFIVGIFFFGLGLDMVFSRLDIDAAALVHMQEEDGLLAYLSAVALWVGIGWHLWQKRRARGNGDSCDGARGGS
jgi:uncharacterized membrane protein YraQ (UPF0718 family)